jgi:prevent-host-death family protein
MINLAENIKPVSYITTHTDEVMRQVADTGAPMIMTQNGEAKLVLLDVKRYQNMMDTINLLKILSIGEHDIQNERYSTTKELDTKVAAVLDA